MTQPAWAAHCRCARTAGGASVASSVLRSTAAPDAVRVMHSDECLRNVSVSVRGEPVPALCFLPGPPRF